jgi:hypothetical protein
MSDIQKALLDYQQVASEIDGTFVGKIFEDGSYFEENHKQTEALRVRRDTSLIKFLETAQERISFVRLEKTEANYVLIYNPFPENFNVTGITLVNIPAAKVKNAGKLYDLANRTILWFFKAMTGNIDAFFIFCFRTWIQTGSYKTNQNEFVKKVVNTIRFNPHEECDTYAIYVNSFVDFLRKFEKDERTIYGLTIAIIKGLRCVCYANQMSKLTEEQINEMILKKSTIMTIQECSKCSHGKLKKINFKSENSINALAQIMKRGREIDEEREKSLNAINQSLLLDSVPEKKPYRVIDIPNTSVLDGNFEEHNDLEERTPKVRRTDVVPRPTVLPNQPDYTEEEIKLANDLLPNVPLQ